MTKHQIRALRRQLDEDVDQFGSRFGRSGRTIENWEQGRRMPDRFIQRLMQELSTGLDRVKPKRTR